MFRHIISLIGKTLWKYRLPILVSVLLLWYAFCLPKELFNDPCCTVLEDTNGELLGAKIATDGQWRFPMGEKVSDKFAKAIIAYEDRRFYSHQGFDLIAIGRALTQNIRAKRIEEGGSTLSMQVIRLSRKGKPRNVKEKIIELILSSRLELRYSKDEILALYAANAPFGGNVVGVEAAAWRYYGRSSEDLSWGEAATLAVLPNAPSIIHPGRNRAQLLAKRNRLIDILKDEGHLDTESAELAKHEPLPLQPLPLPMDTQHLLDRVAVNHKGERVHSTIDQHLQTRVSKLLNRYVTDFRSNKINNAAAIVIEIETGNVVAYVGNATDNGKEDHGSNVDVIIAPRSTGSILKPFLFAAMIEEGSILSTTLIADYPIHIAGFSPNNYNKTFDGAVTAKAALARSLNVPSVRMLQSYNVEKFHRLLKQLGMTTLTKPSGHYGLSLILGGAEGRLWDIANMYVYIARTLNHFRNNEGLYDPNDLSSISFFKNAEKPKSGKLEKSTLLSAAACWQTVEALSEVNRPEEEASWKAFSSSRKVAWKTGTSYGNRDAWAVGITPHYAVGVWVGNANGEGRPLLTGVGYAAPLLFEIYGLLPKSNEWFGRPYDELKKIAVCNKSGYPASDLCEQVDSMWVAQKGLEMQLCPYHIQVHLSQDERYRVSSNCYAVSQMITKSWFILPPAQEWYYRSSHPDYRTLPPLHPECQNTESLNPIELIYPARNTEIVITRQLDGSAGSAVFQAVHRDKNAAIFWHIDNEYVGTTLNEHRIALAPNAGSHRLHLIDENGNTLTARFTVKDRDD